MRTKIASFNRVADNSMILISKISSMNDLVRSLLLQSDQDAIDKIAQQARDLEASILVYQDALVSAVKEISSDEEDEEIEIESIHGEQGFLIN